MNPAFCSTHVFFRPPTRTDTRLGRRLGRRHIPALCCLDPEDGYHSPISVRNLHFTWPNGRPGLRDISFDVAPGELAMVVGHNGCGKSTLLRVLRGLLNPTSGEVYLKSPCAFVFQNPDIQILMPSIGTDIALSLPNTGYKSKENVRKGVVRSMEAVGLTPPEKFMRMSSHRLSGGEKQRAAIAAALAKEPDTILFDEITASLDPVSRAEILERVRSIICTERIAGIW